MYEDIYSSDEEVEEDDDDSERENKDEDERKTLSLRNVQFRLEHLRGTLRQVNAAVAGASEQPAQRQRQEALSMIGEPSSFWWRKNYIVRLSLEAGDFNMTPLTSGRGSTSTDDMSTDVACGRKTPNKPEKGPAAAASGPQAYDVSMSYVTSGVSWAPSLQRPGKTAGLSCRRAWKSQAPKNVIPILKPWRDMDGTSQRRTTLPRSSSGDSFTLGLRVDAAIGAVYPGPKTKRGSQGPRGENFATSSIGKKEDIDLEGHKEYEELSSGLVSSGGGSDGAAFGYPVF
ncbi:hypothetical protein MAPG_01500 [Magnaporthiopsis poae ATCC 64411]|uniref:Uncharacterized protein n=1 Tax=Magnaporthiopsis poae (strain ATCC 64411 / 73-15) TaxID=644358 RepID=A0A0C4DNV3_MAGP6|nr:hypothetical protein MAPG_01500 [Magnaporthiopsis poae ATCC 64411]